MCVVAIAWKAHPQWRLLLAGNRDEFHARASAPLHRWDDVSSIIAGRDLVSGGSWLGVSDEGRLAVVTNIRDADGPDPQKLSRGALVSEWLKSGDVHVDAQSFNPFNLIIADTFSAKLISNRPATTILDMASGIHGLSNAIPDEHWPRKDRLVAQLAHWLAGPTSGAEQLLDLLADESTPDRDAHPVFIRSPIYGTRCSTVIAIDQIGNGEIFERSFDSAGDISDERKFAFTWPT